MVSAREKQLREKQLKEIKKRGKKVCYSWEMAGIRRMFLAPIQEKGLQSTRKEEDSYQDFDMEVADLISKRKMELEVEEARNERVYKHTRFDFANNGINSNEASKRYYTPADLKALSVERDLWTNKSDKSDKTTHAKAVLEAMELENQRTSRLLRLPIELRTQIYRHLLTDHHIDLRKDPLGIRIVLPSETMPLCQTSRQLRRELHSYISSLDLTTYYTKYPEPLFGFCQHFREVITRFGTADISNMTCLVIDLTGRESFRSPYEEADSLARWLSKMSSELRGLERVVLRSDYGGGNPVLAFVRNMDPKLIAPDLRWLLSLLARRSIRVETDLRGL